MPVPCSPYLCAEGSEVPSHLKQQKYHTWVLKLGELFCMDTRNIPHLQPTGTLAQEETKCMMDKIRESLLRSCLRSVLPIGIVRGGKEGVDTWALSTYTDTLPSLSQLGVWLQLTPHSWLCGDGGGSADPAPVPNASPGPPTRQDGPSEPLGHWGHLPPACPHQSQPWGPGPTGELLEVEGLVFGGFMW